MTTLAYRDGVLAADSAITCGSMYQGTAPKIHKLPGGCIFAWSGTMAVAMFLLEHLSRLEDFCPRPGLHIDLPDHKWLEGGYEAWILAPDGTLYSFNDERVLLHVTAPYAATGSGCCYAMGAMAAGATAEEAIVAAAKCEIHTGGPVQLYKVAA
jgi:ATP-dependent protease HslVU (ClpYQ) peptidase subunit